MIRPAVASDADALTRLSFAAKAYWGYPQDYFAVWADELTITPAYIDRHDLFVSIRDGEAAGYYSLIELPDAIEVSGALLQAGFWLEHMFVAPGKIGRGIGGELFTHLRGRCIDRGIREVGILADPNARGFYERMGCEYRGEHPSSIRNRTTPYLLLKL